MKVAVVFDGAGTLAKILRSIKEIDTGRFLCQKQTVDIVDEKKGRALFIIKDDPLEILCKEDSEKLISEFLYNIDFGVSYCNPPINAKAVFNDKKAKVRELKEPLSKLIERNAEMDFGSALVVDTYNSKIEYTIATAGVLFPEVAETIEKLKSMGIEVFIASGDRKGFVKKLAKLTGVDEKNIVPEAHQGVKKKLIKELKSRGYFTIMVGDGSNDVPAMLESNLAVATLQNGYASPRCLEVAHIRISNIKEILGICKNLI